MANNKDYIDSFLDDVEREKVRQFVDDETMLEAVRKVLLAGLYENGVNKKGKKANPLYNGAFGLVSNGKEVKVSNQELGEDLRALWEGLKALESGISNLSKYKTEPVQPKKVGNQAR